MRIALATLALLLVPTTALAIRATPPAVEGKVTLGPATKRSGPLSAEEVEKTMRARTGIFRACYLKELTRSSRSGRSGSTLRGKIVLSFEVQTDGTVKLVEIAKDSTLKDPAVQNCIKSNVMRIAFPDYALPSQITYPMTFAKK